MKSRSMHLAVHVHKDPAAMAERAAHHLVECCEQAIEERGIFNLAISGGTTPLPLFRLLAGEDWVERLPWEKIAVYWVDERCVDPSDPDSNYGNARKELLAHVPLTRFYRMKGEDDPVKAAMAYEELLKEHFELKEGEFPRFDYLLLGLGTDSHIASLFLGAQGMQEKERLVIDQFIHSTNADRLTLTIPVINNARNVVFLVSGADKFEPLSHSLNLLQEPYYPAQFIKPKGELIWIIDEEAAQGKLLD